MLVHVAQSVSWPFHPDLSATPPFHAHRKLRQHPDTTCPPLPATSSRPQRRWLAYQATCPCPGSQALARTSTSQPCSWFLGPLHLWRHRLRVWRGRLLLGAGARTTYTYIHTASTASLPRAAGAAISAMRGEAAVIASCSDDRSVSSARAPWGPTTEQLCARGAACAALTLTLQGLHTPAVGQGTGRTGSQPAATATTATGFAGTFGQRRVLTRLTQPWRTHRATGPPRWWETVRQNSCQFVSAVSLWLAAVSTCLLLAGVAWQGV